MRYHYNSKILFHTLLLLLFYETAFSQVTLDTSFIAYRHGKHYNTESRKLETISLCGENIIADTMGFFTMQSGCERNIAIFLGHYTYKADTFKIIPFDYINESQFLFVNKIPSSNAIQNIQFFTADFQPMKGNDSSWVVRLFKRKKSITIDKTGAKVISIKRNQFEGMELLQMSKLYGVPIILFLDPRFDYKIVLNLPKEAIERYITGGSSLGGTGLIKDNLFFLNNDPEGFKIIGSRKP